jgi:hypothetical protein
MSLRRVAGLSGHSKPFSATMMWVKTTPNPECHLLCVAKTCSEADGRRRRRDTRRWNGCRVLRTNRNCESKKHLDVHASKGRLGRRRLSWLSTRLSRENKCEQSAARNQGATPPAASCIDDEVRPAVHRRSRSH